MIGHDVGNVTGAPSRRDAMTTAASVLRSGIVALLVAGILFAANAGSLTASLGAPTGSSGSFDATSPAPATAASPSAGLGDGLAGDLIGPGRLVICSSFPRPRFAEHDADGRPFGVDIEIGQELALRLGLEPEVRDQLFETLIDSVVDGGCDVSVAGQFITSARLALIDMIPYRQGTPHVVVRAGDPLADGELTDLCGRTLAVVSGTVHIDIIRGLGDYVGRGVDDQCLQAGQALVELREYPSQEEAEDALARGDTDAYVGNDFVTVDRPADFALGMALPPVRNGIGVRKDTASLHAGLRAALGSLIEDGSYLAILERYAMAHVAVTGTP